MRRRKKEKKTQKPVESANTTEKRVSKQAEYIT
jgi:hypothetical protein